MSKTLPSITVDIWSDIVCPFCYIGKRRLEHALSTLQLEDKVVINWHSFQLDPGLKRNSDTDTYVQHLSEKKGINEEQVKLMMERVSYMAREIGLKYNLEKNIVANTFKAHQLLQLAKVYGEASNVKENLMHAHFILNEDVENEDVLLKCTQNTTIPEAEVQRVLQSKSYTEEISNDQNLASKLGITGVPFFVFNNKFGLSGAQPEEVFEKALKQALED